MALPDPLPLNMDYSGAVSVRNFVRMPSNDPAVSKYRNPTAPVGHVKDLEIKHMAIGKPGTKTIRDKHTVKAIIAAWDGDSQYQYEVAGAPITITVSWDVPRGQVDRQTGVRNGFAQILGALRGGNGELFFAPDYAKFVDRVSSGEA